MDEADSVLIYVLAFVFIAISWNNHHHLLRAARRISSSVMWANMTLLEMALLRANYRDSLLGRALSNRAKGYSSLALYAAAVVLAPVSVWVSYALYAGVAVLWLVPDRRFTRIEAR